MELMCGSFSLRLNLVFSSLGCFFPSVLCAFVFLSEEWRSCGLVPRCYVMQLEVLIECWKTAPFEHVCGGNGTRLPLWFAFSFFALPAFSWGSR